MFSRRIRALAIEKAAKPAGFAASIHNMIRVAPLALSARSPLQQEKAGETRRRM
jgi:hypothetical protein